MSRRCVRDTLQSPVLALSAPSTRGLIHRTLKPDHHKGHQATVIRLYSVVSWYEFSIRTSISFTIHSQQQADSPSARPSILRKCSGSECIRKMTSRRGQISARGMILIRLRGFPHLPRRVGKEELGLTVAASEDVISRDFKGTGVIALRRRRNREPG